MGFEIDTLGYNKLIEALQFLGHPVEGFMVEFYRFLIGELREANLLNLLLYFQPIPAELSTDYYSFSKITSMPFFSSSLISVSKIFAACLEMV